MMTIETLIEQNNRTVSFLEAKDFSNACWASAEALRCQKEMINSHLNLDDSELTNALDRCTLCSQNGDDTERTYDIEGNTFFIYDQGIPLSLDTVLDKNTTSAILVFNTALARQLCAINVPPGEQSALIEAAKRLYELAYKSLHRTSHNTVFQFAILNNLAVIERILGNGAASNEYLDHLLSFWMCSLAVNHPHNSSRQLRCMQGFLWNVLGGKDNTAAAA